ncbi:hypothetical protein RHGRI_032916 [Rhododendron griersonianum]|uniref:Uncharacterized protein n=1 Tax=Rhododendron griersonianum TaxID=479676 RepID=A0AAV6IE61_9ERIC|nr:hypothetical protein RHGRI_032916 [Rhododendron griersonianum]
MLRFQSSKHLSVEEVVGKYLVRDLVFKESEETIDKLYSFISEQFLLTQKFSFSKFRGFGSGKTSLLFQFAFNSALESDSIKGNVVFICNRSKLESKPPFLPQMKYVDNDEGIKKYFAAFHRQDNFPRTVVIDDFGDLFDERKCQERYNNARGRDLAMVRTLALCHSAITHANEKGPCNLLLSDTHHGDSPRLLFIYKRWISSVYTIKGDGSGSFLLKNNISSGSSLSDRTKTAKYSIALQYLVLEVITEDGES